MEFLTDFRTSQMKYQHTQLTNSFKSTRSKIEQKLSLIIQKFSKDSALKKQEIKNAIEELNSIKQEFRQSSKNGINQLKNIQNILKLYQNEQKTPGKDTNRIFFNHFMEEILTKRNQPYPNF
jgi:arginine deiminase